jgi:hypothetical protein
MVAKRRTIAPEIAERYGRAVATVTGTWRKHPDWPAPIGKRGRWAEYDAEAVDQVVRRLFVRAAPPAEGDPDDLLTIADIVTYTGLKRGTIDADISRDRWAPPDSEEHGVRRWKRATVNQLLAGRRGYRRHAQPDAEEG